MSPAPAPSRPHGPHDTLTRTMVVVGASAGGIEALRALVARLPADLPAAVLVVIHTAPNSPQLVPGILQASGPLPVAYASHGALVARGHIYVAPPDHHLILAGETMQVVRGPKENRARPAIDPLFRSAAWAYGPQAIGVVLSGMLNDGTAGLWAIKSCGGIAVVQDPEEARFGDMPRHALAHVPVDHRLTADAIGELVGRLVRQPIDAAHLSLRRSEQVGLETKMARVRENDMNDMNRIGKLSPYTCPACKGSLWEVDDANVLRFRCHTGHAFTAEDLADSQDDGIENALYAAVRALEESGKLSAAVAVRARDDDRERLAEVYEARARDAEHNADLIRALLVRPRTPAA